MSQTLELAQVSKFSTQQILDMEYAKQVISQVRAIRSQKNIAPKQTLKVIDCTGHATDKEIIEKLANAELTQGEKPSDATAFMVGTDEFAVPLGDLIDVKAELEKAEAQLQHLEGFLAGVMKKLSNERFVANAPEAVVAMERKKQADSEEKIASLKQMIEELKKK